MNIEDVTWQQKYYALMKRIPYANFRDCVFETPDLALNFALYLYREHQTPRNDIRAALYAWVRESLISVNDQSTMQTGYEAAEGLRLRVSRVVDFKFRNSLMNFAMQQTFNSKYTEERFHMICVRCAILAVALKAAVSPLDADNYQNYIASYLRMNFTTPFKNGTEIMDYLHTAVVDFAQNSKDVNKVYAEFPFIPRLTKTATEMFQSVVDEHLVVGEGSSFCPVLYREFNVAINEELLQKGFCLLKVVTGDLTDATYRIDHSCIDQISWQVYIRVICNLSKQMVDDSNLTPRKWPEIMMERTMLTEDVKTLISLANLSAYRKILNIREGEAVSEDYDSFTQVQYYKFLVCLAGRDPALLAKATHENFCFETNLALTGLIPLVVDNCLNVRHYVSPPRAGFPYQVTDKGVIKVFKEWVKGFAKAVEPMFLVTCQYWRALTLHWIASKYNCIHMVPSWFPSYNIDDSILPHISAIVNKAYYDHSHDIEPVTPSWSPSKYLQASEGPAPKDKATVVRSRAQADRVQDASSDDEGLDTSLCKRARVELFPGIARAGPSDKSGACADSGAKSKAGALVPAKKRLVRKGKSAKVRHSSPVSPEFGSARFKNAYISPLPSDDDGDMRRAPASLSSIGPASGIGIQVPPGCFLIDAGAVQVTTVTDRFGNLVSKHIQHFPPN